MRQEKKNLTFEILIEIVNAEERRLTLKFKIVISLTKDKKVYLKTSK